MVPSTIAPRSAVRAVAVLAAAVLLAAPASCRPGEPADVAATATPAATPAADAPAAGPATGPTKVPDDPVLPRFAASLAFDPADPDHAWFTLERGIVETRDGGLQWTVVEGLKTEPGQRIVAMTAGGDALFAGGTGILLASTDGGATWAPVAQHGAARVRGLTADPADDARLLVLIEGTGIVATSDGGATWAAVDGDVPEQAYGLWTLALDPPRLVTIDRAAGRPLVSEDGGATWAPLAADGLEGELLGFAPGDGIAYAATGSGLRVSEDGGATWTARGPFPELVAVASAPGDRDTVLVVVPGGQVYRSRDRGQDWFDPNAPTRTPTAEAAATGESPPSGATLVPEAVRTVEAQATARAAATEVPTTAP